ncbi:MAG: DUF748 domain-containing protein [Flavobacteriales bacterium]
MKISGKIKKIAFIVLGIVLLLVVLAIVFISPIAKYLVEKYDEKYTGREITADWAYVNPFTGYVHLNDVEIHEKGSNSIFLYIEGLSANFSWNKLLSGTYEIEYLVVDGLKGKIVQDNKKFNFNDLIEKFSSDDDPTKAPVHLNILDIEINESELLYVDPLVPLHYSITDINIESDGKRWNVDSINTLFSFSSGKDKGTMSGYFNINIKNKDYLFSAEAKKFDLQIIDQYLKDLSNYGHFSANLDAKIAASGSFEDARDIKASGYLALNDLHFGKDKAEDYVSAEKIVLQIKELNPKNNKYFFDSLMLLHPFLKYERYDYLDNIQRIFGEKGANVKAVNSNPQRFNLILEIADYVKILAKNFFKTDYKINRLSIYRGDLRFNDYSLSEKFSMGIYPLNFLSDSISKNNKWVNAVCSATFQPYGTATINVRMNPKQSDDFDLSCTIKKIPAALFNPYLITYTSYPMDRGTIQFKSQWKVCNGEIQSENHLLLLDPRLTKKIKKEDAKWLPMPLIVAFVRENGNVIDYEIPVRGNLNDPHFQLWDVLRDLVKNIFIKPPTMPYSIYVENVENEIEKSHAIQWPLRQPYLNPKQEKYTQKLANFLKENKGSQISVTPFLYEEKEKEYILFFEAKKKYFMAMHGKKHISEDDSITINKMSVKDSSFVYFLDRNPKNLLAFTIQEKCANIIDNRVIEQKTKQLTAMRKKEFSTAFKANGTLNQIHFLPQESNIPYNGFSFLKIAYKGDIPNDLKEAYQKLNELVEEVPRKKYSRLRGKVNALMTIEKN